MQILLIWLAIINLTTFLVYGYDKYRAATGGWRVSERTLLLLAIIGGSVGALIGMHLFRHKTAKASFQWRFWSILAVQVILIILCFMVL
ncbi:MAG: DUF1294 domain-containing protein [Chloroflexota bacterium]|nr:DUF1294 domain-containing protein [Chloroflexota bacterium]